MYSWSASPRVIAFSRICTIPIAVYNTIYVSQQYIQREAETIDIRPRDRWVQTALKSKRRIEQAQGDKFIVQITDSETNTKQNMPFLLHRASVRIYY